MIVEDHFIDPEQQRKDSLHQRATFRKKSDHVIPPDEVETAP